jgi:hypothetical protein
MKSRQPERHHYGLSPGTGKPPSLGALDPSAQLLSEINLVGCWKAEARTFANRVRRGLDDLAARMPVHQRGVIPLEIEHLVAVGID